MKEAEGDRAKLTPENALLLEKAVERLQHQLPHDPELQATMPEPELIKQVVREAGGGR